MQVGSAHSDQMRTSGTYFKDLWPRLPSWAVLHLGHFPFSSWQGLMCQVCGAAVVRCFCTSSTACERGNKETPRAWRDPRSLQMSGAVARLHLQPLFDRHGFISPWGFPWAPGMSEPGAAGHGRLPRLGVRQISGDAAQAVPFLLSPFPRARLALPPLCRKWICHFPYGKRFGEREDVVQVGRGGVSSTQPLCSG